MEHAEKTGSIRSTLELRDLLEKHYGAGSLPLDSNIRVFRDGVLPTWEDRANVRVCPACPQSVSPDPRVPWVCVKVRGGRWILAFTRKKTGVAEILDVMDRTFKNQFQWASGVTGVVLSIRRWGCLVSVWLTRCPTKAQQPAAEAEFKSFVTPRSSAVMAYIVMPCIVMERPRPSSNPSSIQGPIQLWPI